jgi:RNA polymerase sigma-70 factor (ECF subfamily)
LPGTRLSEARYCAALPGSPEEAVIKETVTNALRRIIGSIPQKYRDVVILRVYGELPFSQVAKVLGITESSAKVLYFRDKKMLMEELHNEFDM